MGWLCLWTTVYFELISLTIEFCQWRATAEGMLRSRRRNRWERIQRLERENLQYRQCALPKEVEQPESLHYRTNEGPFTANYCQGRNEQLIRKNLTMLALAFVLIISTLIMDHSTIYLYQLLRDKLSVMAPPAVTGSTGSSIHSSSISNSTQLLQGHNYLPRGGLMHLP